MQSHGMEKEERDMTEKEVRRELEAFRHCLEAEEKAEATIEKYLRDVSAFFRFIQGENADKKGVHHISAALTAEHVHLFKQALRERYRPSSVNSMLYALNKYLRFKGRDVLCVKALRVQRRLFYDDSRLIRRSDYRRLVEQADREGRKRLSCILQTLAMTGIRVGELHHISCEGVQKRLICIAHKGKLREIVLPQELVGLLQTYCSAQGISRGSIFVTRSGRPVDRKNVWAEMKALCRRAGVMESRVYPHNLRHLFAVSFYERKKDIVRLADYLGHSSLETTRRYTALSSFAACQRELNLGLLISEIGAKKDRRIVGG